MSNRTDYIITEIKNYQKELIASNPDAVRIKFRKMSKNPFNFYRGTAHLFYADMKRYSSEFVNEKTGRVWIQGDLHIGNFGTYKDSSGHIIYDVNDYDECYLAPFVWDIWRAAASIILIARQQQLADIPEKDFIIEYVMAFCEKIKQFAEDRSERDFRIDLTHSQGEVKKILETAYAESRSDFLNRFTEIYRGVRRFKVNEKQGSLSSDIRNRIILAFYEQYIPSIPLSKRHNPDYYSVESIDMIEAKGAGIGSAGQKMFSFLIRGESDSADDDIIIGAKIARASVVMNYVDSNFFPDGHIKNEAIRCVLGQRAMQINADPFLGYFEYDGKPFYVSELSPCEKSVNLNEIRSSKDFLSILHQMGRATAKIHAVSDRDADESLIPYSADKEIANVIAGREERFLTEVYNFAIDYADIVEAVKTIMQNNTASFFEPNADALQRLIDIYPFFVITNIPSGIYPHQDEDITTIGVRTLLVGRNDLDNQSVYTLTKSIFSHMSLIASHHKNGIDISLNSALKGISIPVNAGANRFYIENG